MSLCADPADSCSIPEAAGGRRFFADASAPNGQAFWDCVDRDENPLACGACGVSCDASERCCGGSCLDVAGDSANCGACGNACPDGAPYVRGACCAPGETVCFGGCTDLRTNRAHCGACETGCEVSAHCSDSHCCSSRAPRSRATAAAG